MNWTSERPTKPGEYWLSFPPAERNRWSPSSVKTATVLQGLDALHVSWADENGHYRLLPLAGHQFDNAKWSRRETPADPFAKTAMHTDQEGCEYNHDDREQKLNPDALVKKAIHHLRKRKPKNGHGYVYPLWKRVSDLFGHGSGYSAEICRRHGFDPDEQWKPEEVTSC